ncbi:RNA polymerase sigma factor [Bacillus phage Kioshi]|nr:RNA polymerase sigma factor [Bacillus phage Kioshi]
MKLINISEKEILLELKTTDKKTEEVCLPKDNIHFWYPFNINFYYKYSSAKGYMYLVQDKHYEGANIYQTTILKRTKKLMKHEGVPLNLPVYERNSYIMAKAFELGIPTSVQDYTSESVQHGFDTLAATMGDLRNEIEDRYVKAVGKSSPPVNTEKWDREMYKHATEEELAELQEYGEMYTMLSVMRKLVQ